MAEKEDIVIVGGGIIGCTTAYYLTRHPLYDPSRHNITLIEATKIAGGASGKAGGLLALWAYPSNIVPLSFKLHSDLAKEHNGADKWGYRRIHVGQLRARGRDLPSAEKKSETVGDSAPLPKRDEAAMGKLTAAGIPKDLDWFSPESMVGYEEMGNPENTAQVHPYQFTTSMAELAQEKGLKVVIGSVTAIDTPSGNSSETRAVSSVTYTDKETSESHTVPASKVILTAGPWTSEVFPLAPIEALRAHSVTIRPARPVSAYAIFTQIALAGNNPNQRSKKTSKTATPEIYARPNNEVYACGEGDTIIPLPSSTDLVQVDQSRCQDIIDHVSSISDELRFGEVTARQACYLPNVIGGGGPLIGETGFARGLLIAAGHTCWGIQNAPATGMLMSEFVFDGKAKSANVSTLDPKRVIR